MSRISKTVASEMAESMTKDRREVLSKLNSELAEFVEEKLLSLVPKEITDLNAEGYKYVLKNEYYSLKDGGKRLGAVYLKNSIPLLSNQEMSKKDNSKAVKMFYEIQKEQESIKKLTSDIESTIHYLRTPKRLQEHFPEAVKHLPTESKASPLVVDVSSIMKRL